MIPESLIKLVPPTRDNPLGEAVVENPHLRSLFLVTFVDESPQQTPIPPQPTPLGVVPARTITIPAFVESYGEAEKQAKEFAKHFADYPEGKNNPQAKLRIQSITYGGTLLT